METRNKGKRIIRAAIIGSGPAGFYTAEHLLKQTDFEFEADMFDRLPTPHGLVRSGVAPDHQKIKSVTKVYDKIASSPRFRFFGLVEFGRHITLEDLKRHYHVVIFATGAQTDRKLGIPGEDLKGNHTATEFVAWYNGHPDYRHMKFDLSGEKAAVIGVGNVAIDVARILCRTVDELRKTDIADYALEALGKSRVRDVYLLGRRGPLQAAFTNPEVRELGKLTGAHPVTLPHEVGYDEFIIEAVETNKDQTAINKIEILRSYSDPRHHTKNKRLHIRFLVSPVEIIGDAGGHVAALKLAKNELYRAEDGSVRSRPTGEFEELEAGIVFRSIGYQGVPLPGVPFHEKWGVIENEKGRVTDPGTGGHMKGLYAAGWIKRGPTGVIGTNKQDAGETVGCIIEDVRSGAVIEPPEPDPDSVLRLVSGAQPDYVTYEDWLGIDHIEIERGKASGRPRVKFTSVEEILEALKSRKKAANSPDQT
ncbi:MAG: NADP oxidoreductase [Candidatus Dadabacteria bacterium RIFCSPHIGHO2_12_FULL_53_21]|nr:MAG: NADP oxidoreductase [Candidatus Dadabacteria bacterium RIFCSPHIGHO2_12_FULL_53_21]